MTDRDEPAARPPQRIEDPWAALRNATPARIGLGRTGDTLPLRPVLDLQLAHARARDAVHTALDIEALAAGAGERPVIHVRSMARDRADYLKRPDLGRALHPESQADLQRHDAPDPDCVFIIADGLSAVAASTHALPLLARTLPLLGGLSVGPAVIATQARVALGDAIGESLQARLSIVLIGERPGLSVADSLGVYLTYAPRVGRRDSERNCISNIHPNGGLSYPQAATKLAWLIREALNRRASGIALKDEDHGGILS